MLKKFMVLGMLISGPVYAGDYHILDLEHFDMGYAQFKDNRDPYAPEYNSDWLYRASTNFRFSIMGALYMDNYVHFEAVDSGTPKTVGWHWTVGLRLTEQIDIFDEHHSRHIMEDYRPSYDGHNTFPVEDSYGIRITFHDNPKVKKSVSSWIFGD